MKLKKYVQFINLTKVFYQSVYWSIPYLFYILKDSMLNEEKMKRYNLRRRIIC